MNEKKMHDEQETLEDVLDAYVASITVPSQQALKEWIRRYPHYRRELLEFTVSWTKMEHLPLLRMWRSQMRNYSYYAG